MTSPIFNRNSTNLPNRYNRGTDNKEVEGVSTEVTVDLHTIDNAILKYLQTKVRPTVMQNGKQIQVPVIYGNPERWKSAQQDGNIRDKNGMIMLPLMMIRRTSIKKNAINNPTNKYQQYTFKTGWNPRNIYDRFTVVNRITPSQVYHASMVPDYYDISYEAMVWTEYMEQMNKLIENISFESNEYWGEDNSYKFISKIDNYELLTELPANNARLVRSKFNIEVKGYILPQFALNKTGMKSPTTRLEYTTKKVVFSTETVREI